MEVVRKYELYETIDVKASGNAGNISRGEKLSMPNIVFNNLAKVEEAFFEANFQQIIDKKISLRSLTEKNLKMKEIQKVFGVLAQITGYQTLETLRREYPGKFEIDKVGQFLGAEMKGESKNLQAMMLENYYEGVTKHVIDDVPVKFECIKSLDEPKVRAIIDTSDAIVVVMKISAKEECASISKMILQCDKIFKVGFFLFPSEIMSFDVLTFLRSQNTSMIKDFKIIPVFFTNQSSPTKESVEENLTHGIIFGKFDILNPPFKVFPGLLKVEEVLVKVVPPESTIAVISEPGLAILQAHSEHLPFKSVVYHGSDKELRKFREKLTRDKLLLTKQEVGESAEESTTSPAKHSRVSNKQSSTRPDAISTMSNKESSTSLFKESTVSNKERSLSNKDSSTSPAKQISTGPAKESFISPVEESSTSPAKEPSNSPAKEPSDSPAKEPSNSPDKESWTSSAEETSISPAKESFTSPAIESSLKCLTSPVRESTSQGRKSLSTESSTCSQFEFKDESDKLLSQDSGYESSPFVSKDKSKVAKKLIYSVGFSDNLDIISGELD